MCCHLFDICLAFVWHSFDSCLTCGWHLFDTCLTFVWQLFDICWHVFDICLTFFYIFLTCFWHIIWRLTPLPPAPFSPWRPGGLKDWGPSDIVVRKLNPIGQKHKKTAKYKSKIGPGGGLGGVLGESRGRLGAILAPKSQKMSVSGSVLDLFWELVGIIAEVFFSYFFQCPSGSIFDPIWDRFWLEFWSIWELVFHAS